VGCCLHGGTELKVDRGEWVYWRNTGKLIEKYGGERCWSATIKAWLRIAKDYNYHTVGWEKSRPVKHEEGGANSVEATGKQTGCRVEVVYLRED